MAIYHLHIAKLNRAPTKRSPKGRSSVQKLCYITATKGMDERTGIVYDNTKKNWEVVYTKTYLPKEAKEEWKDNPLRLFNDLELFEKRPDCKVAFDMDAALPAELTLNEQIEIVEQFSKWLTNRGFCITAAIHDKYDGNPHVHLLTTTRPVSNGQFINKVKKDFLLDKDGNRIPIIDPETGEQKLRVRTRVINGKEYTTSEKLWKTFKVEDNPLDSRDLFQQIRKQWRIINNLYLSEENKISELSYKDQGIDKIPGIHLSAVARAIDSSGEYSIKVEKNKDIQLTNLENEIKLEQEKLNNQQETILIKIKNKLERTIEQLQLEIARKLDNAYNKVKSFFINNLDNEDRFKWNRQVEPRFQAITNQELAADIEGFIKSNNTNVKQEYPGYLYDHIFTLIRTHKITDLIKTIKKNINDNNKGKGNQLIELLNTMNENKEVGLSMRHTLKM